jgi:hypothetical protein
MAERWGQKDKGRRFFCPHFSASRLVFDIRRRWQRDVWQAQRGRTPPTRHGPHRNSRMRRQTKKTCKNTKTCDILVRVGCRILFVDKLQTSRRGASTVCDRERRRDVGGNAPRPDASRAGPRVLPTSRFRNPGRGQPQLPSTGFTHGAPTAETSCQTRAQPRAARTRQPRGPQMENAPRRQEGGD